LSEVGFAGFSLAKGKNPEHHQILLSEPGFTGLED
jgi:hypothetical protein